MVWQCTMHAETNAPARPVGLVASAALIVLFISAPYAKKASVYSAREQQSAAVPAGQPPAVHLPPEQSRHGSFNMLPICQLS